MSVVLLHNGDKYDRCMIGKKKKYKKMAGTTTSYTAVPACYDVSVENKK